MFKVVKNGKECVQNGSKGVKRCQNDSKGAKMVKRCQNGPMRGIEGSKWGEEGKEGKKAMNGLLAHPFPCENGLLSTLSGKGG